MKTYIMAIKDRTYGDEDRIRIDEKQKKLIDHLCDEYGLEDMFYDCDMDISIIEEKEGTILDLT